VGLKISIEIVNLFKLN